MFLVLNCGATPENDPATWLALILKVPRPVKAETILPRKWTYGPIYGTDCETAQPFYCDPVDVGGMAEQAFYHLNKLTQYDIPITSYDFDGPAWSNYPVGRCEWSIGTPIIDELKTRGLKAILHFWAGCRTESQLDRAFNVVGSDVLGAFYLDNGASDETASTIVSWTNRRIPVDGSTFLKAVMGPASGMDDPAVPSGAISRTLLEKCGCPAYVDDLAVDFVGLREGAFRVLDQSTSLAIPYAEYTGFDFAVPTKESFLRRLHFGATQVVMHHVQGMGADVWGSVYATDTSVPGVDLVERLRFWSWFHLELAPYFYSYAWQAMEDGRPIFRSQDKVKYTTLLGNELFIAYVTTPSVTTVNVTLPSGTWVNLWNTSQVFVGPGPAVLPAPPGQEPVLLRVGSIVPLDVSRSYTGRGTAESATSLTVLVVSGSSASFKYRDEGNNSWVNFSTLEGTSTINLYHDSPVSKPILWRLELWNAKPSQVAVSQGTVLVNGAGTLLPELADEKSLNGSTVSGWFYDNASTRLLIKVIE